MEATSEKQSSADKDDVMMESTSSNPSDSGLGSETSSLNSKPANFDRERRESTSSNPSDVMMMPPSPVSREQVSI